VRLEVGAPVRIASLEAMPEPGTAARIATTYPHLAEDLRAGDRVLLDDGAMELRVESTEPAPAGSGDIDCRVISGGELRERKGVNLPGATLRVPALTPKDEADLAFGIARGVDLIALSFVRTPEDIRHAKRVMKHLGGRQPLIAKIEKPQAVDALEAIVRVSDGIMVARATWEWSSARRRSQRCRGGQSASRTGEASGHHRDPDAGIDDDQPLARPGPRPATSPMPSSTAPTRLCSRERRQSGPIRSRPSR
jgi:hypothetical protein